MKVKVINRREQAWKRYRDNALVSFYDHDMIMNFKNAFMAGWDDAKFDVNLPQKEKHDE
jgi:hypothetical protein